MRHVRKPLRCGTVAVLAFAGALGCNALKTPPPPTERATAAESVSKVVAPGKHHHRVSQFVFYSDFALKTDAPIFQELADLRETITRELQLPPSNTVVQVFLFEDQERYERYMKSRYAELPSRRAFFIKQPRAAGGADDLYVFTYWGDHIRQDLRHELTHGILHSVLRDVPLWLDEGLAEVYELPPEREGVNMAHLDLLRSTITSPDLARLEELSQVQQMQRPQYREAWAWTHLMLRSKPEVKAVLLAYLQQLRRSQPAGPILPKLREVVASPNDAFLEHLAKLDAGRTVRSSAPPVKFR